MRTSHSSYLTLLLFVSLIVFTSQELVVNKIDGVTSNNLMFTGTITVGEQKLFFTYYGVDGQTSVDNLANSPLVIAIGSPGRSAQYSNVGGLGPKVLQKDVTLVDNKDQNRLTAYANAMFLDLIGSGFSFASSSDKIPTTSSDFGNMLTSALNTFFAQADIGKSQNVYLLAEGTFLRSLHGIGDIDPLSGIVHVSPWMDFYQLGKYYGVAGVQNKIFSNVEKITIQSTFTTCYNYQRNQKYTEAHSCYDTTLNYIQTKTKNHNLMNLPLGSNLTDFIALVQYYFSQTQTVTTYKAPNVRLFESHAPKAFSQLYADMAKPLNAQISQYFKDYLSVKHSFINGNNDFLVYSSGVRDWLDNQVTFVQSSKFKALNLTDYKVNDKIVGSYKAVNQIGYYELKSAGHYSYNDDPSSVNSIVKKMVAPSQSDLEINDDHKDEVKKYFESMQLQSE